MKITVKVIAATLVLALMLPLLTMGISADEWGRPDVYGTEEYPQKYGRIGDDINVSTLTDEFEISVTADKRVLNQGRIRFTLTVKGAEEDVDITALGIVPVYNVFAFDPVKVAGQPEPGALAGKFLFDPEPGLETSKWNPNMEAFAVSAAWSSGEPVIVPALVSTDFYEFYLEPKDSFKDPNTEVFVFVTFKKGDLEFSRLVSTSVGEDGRHILSANVSITECLNLKVYARVPYGLTAPVMRFVMDGGEPEMVTGEEFEKGIWQFTYSGIGFENMTDGIRFELYSGIDVIDGRTGFTVKSYAEAILINDERFEAKRLAGRLLLYGNEVQKYLGYNLDKPAADLEVLSDPNLFEEIPKPDGKEMDVTVGDAELMINGVSFGIAGSFDYRFYAASAGEDARVFIGGSTGEELGTEISLEDGETVIKTEPVILLDLDRKYTFDNGGGNTGSLTALGYIAALWDDETEGDIARALFALYIAASLYRGN